MGTDEGSCGCGPTGRGSNATGRKSAEALNNDAASMPDSIRVNAPERLAGHRFSIDTVNEVARFITDVQPVVSPASVTVDTGSPRAQVGDARTGREVSFQDSRVRLVDAGTLARLSSDRNLDAPGAVRVEWPGDSRQIAPLRGAERAETGIQRIEPLIVSIERVPVLRPRDGRSGEGATTYLSRSLIATGPLAGTTLGRLGLLSEQAEGDSGDAALVGEGRPENAGEAKGLELPEDAKGIRDAHWLVDGNERNKIDTADNVWTAIECKEGVVKLEYTVRFSVDLVFRKFSLPDPDNKIDAGGATGEGQKIVDAASSDAKALEMELHKLVCEWAMKELAQKSGRSVPSGSLTGDAELPGPPEILDKDLRCAGDCKPGECVKVYWLECEPVSIAKGPMWYVQKTGNANGQSEFELMVYLEGTVTFVWTIKCVCPPELAKTAAGQALIEEGRMTADGQLIGHSRPPGTAPPPETPSPENCCCIIGKIEATVVPRKEPLFVGHNIRIRIWYWYLKKPPEQECTLEWWELSDNNPPWLESKPDIRSGEWYEGYRSVNESSVFDPWKEREKVPCYDEGEPPPTEAWMNVVEMIDPAGMSRYLPEGIDGRRNLWIKVIAKSGCRGHDPKTVCVYQYLDVDGNQSTGCAKVLEGRDCDNLVPERGKGDNPPRFCDEEPMQ